MPYTVEQLNALKEAISIGATSVKYADKTVEYRSLSDMIRIQGIMEAELYPATVAAKKISRRKLANYGRGYEGTGELG